MKSTLALAVSAGLEILAWFESFGDERPAMHQLLRPFNKVAMRWILDMVFSTGGSRSRINIVTPVLLICWITSGGPTSVVAITTVGSRDNTPSAESQRW
jgi:hypothetical protein